ncbi:MAG: hypothetical protein AAFX85_15310, partial [Pseudomonadota bacterium]
RYRRSYVAYQTYCFDDTPGDSWRLRMAKLRSSRLVTIAGLLAVLGEASRETDSLGAVESRLTSTPVERLYGAMVRWDERIANDMLTHYNAAHGVVEEPACRTALLAGPPVTLAQLEVAPPSLGEVLDAALPALEEVINNFLLAQGDYWPAWFYRALLL